MTSENARCLAIMLISDFKSVNKHFQRKISKEVHVFSAFMPEVGQPTYKH